MFESAITAAVATPHDLAAAGLRTIAWSEIVARLAAARDLRAVFARPTASGGSFGAITAAGIGDSARREPPVNLAALASGKWDAAKISANARVACRGDRDK